MGAFVEVQEDMNPNPVAEGIGDDFLDALLALPRALRSREFTGCLSTVKIFPRSIQVKR